MANRPLKSGYCRVRTGSTCRPDPIMVGNGRAVYHGGSPFYDGANHACPSRLVLLLSLRTRADAPR